jgi:hypothetical protein
MMGAVGAVVVMAVMVAVGEEEVVENRLVLAMVLMALTMVEVVVVREQEMLMV